jgi:DNA repair protein REV1
MLAHSALERCPDLVFLPYPLDRVDTLSAVVMGLLGSCGARTVEPLSVDEAFLDLTGVPNPDGILQDLRSAIYRDTGCTASCGIGPNKLLARLATKKAKPNGQARSPTDPIAIAALLGPMHVSELPGVGWRTSRELRDRFEVTTVAQLRRIPAAALQEAFGPRKGLELRDASLGIDERRVGSELKPRRSVGAEYNWGIRFSTRDQVSRFLDQIAARVANRLALSGVEDDALFWILHRRRRRMAGTTNSASWVFYNSAQMKQRTTVSNVIKDDHLAGKSLRKFRENGQP